MKPNFDRTNRSRVSVFAVVLATSLLASTASAQNTTPAPLAEALSGEAKANYESGKLLYGDGDFAGALVKFKSAYDQSKDARLLWNVAACEKNLRHYSKALTFVRQYLAAGDATLTAEDKAEASNLIKMLEPLTSKLHLKVNEPDAEVVVDGEVVGRTPIDGVIVDVGMRKIQVRKADFQEFTKELSVGGAAEMSLDVQLSPLVHEGRLSVRTGSEAIISLDGKVVGTGTWTGMVKSGGHLLRVTQPKMRSYQSEVVVQDNQTRDVSVTLVQEPSKGLPAWAWIAGGVVVTGGLATAGYFIFKPTDSYEGPAGNLSPGIVQASRPWH